MKCVLKNNNYEVNIDNIVLVCKTLSMYVVNYALKMDVTLVYAWTVVYTISGHVYTSGLTFMYASLDARVYCVIFKFWINKNWILNVGLMHVDGWLVVI